MKRRESGINCFLQMRVIGKSTSVKMELKKMKENSYSWTVGLQLPQKKLKVERGRAKKGSCFD